MQFTTITLLALTSLASALPSHMMARETQLCKDPAGNDQFEWFITPSQGTDCNTDVPAHRPNSGYTDEGATCQPLYNLEQDPNGATNFSSASVTTPCGGWNVIIYTTDDCSDEGVTVSGTNAAPSCVTPTDGGNFTKFSANKA